MWRVIRLVFPGGLTSEQNSWTTRGPCGKWCFQVDRRISNGSSVNLWNIEGGPDKGAIVLFD